MKADNFGGNGNYGNRTRRLWCTAGVTEGDWIAIDSNDATNPAALEGFSFVTADAGVEGDYDTVGVATETTTAAAWVTVQVAGMYTNANVADAVTLGQNLVISATAGRAEAVSTETADTRIIGKALTAGDANNDANVWIYCHPIFLD
jgi:hypothetical protein